MARVKPALTPCLPCLTITFQSELPTGPGMAHNTGNSVASKVTRLMLCLAPLFPFADPAHAGAWPRDKGSGFISAASRVVASSWEGPYGVYSTTYLEYGLGHRVTAGFDIGHAISGTGKAIFFLRKSLPETDGGHVFAGELGLGQIAGAPAIRPGLSYGRGFILRGGGSGWLSLESVAEIWLNSGQTDFKADFTVGFNHGEKFKTILQLQTGVPHGDPAFIRAAPSVVVKMGKTSHLELGLTAGITGDDSYGLKLGFWRKF